MPVATDNLGLDNVDNCAATADNADNTDGGLNDEESDNEESDNGESDREEVPYTAEEEQA